MKTIWYDLLHKTVRIAAEDGSTLVSFSGVPNPDVLSYELHRHIDGAGQVRRVLPTKPRYWLEQDLLEGGTWRSETSFEGDDRQARQDVINGFVNGEPRRAVREDGSVIYALDAKGREVRPEKS